MDSETFEGARTCGAVHYRLASTPMIVHCCHRSWCQREIGSAFAVNAMIETDRLELLQGEPIMVDTPSCSGEGQQIARCALCHLALWGHYPGGGRAVAFVRVGGGIGTGNFMFPSATKPAWHEARDPSPNGATGRTSTHMGQIAFLP